MNTSRRARIERYSVDLDAPGIGRPGLDAPQDGMDARRQLARIEWLREIVVGAQFEADDAVDIFAARRQHQNRLMLDLAKLPQYFKTVETRQHHVQHDQVELPGAGPLQALGAVVLHLDFEPLALEQFRQQRAQFYVVVDQKDAHAQQIA